MTKLWSYLGYPANEHETGIVGIEIETESTKGYPYLTGLEEFWNCVPDGSLRQNGVEYILRRPLSPSTKAYQDALGAFAKQSAVTPFIHSTYSSVHVHLNMLDKTMTEMFNFICLYFLFEEFLAEYCGNDRNGNLFCLKASNAELNYKTAKDMAEAIENGTGLTFIKGLNSGLLKYSALNLVPLRTQGSLEVRLHQGTVDVNEIDRWVQMLMCLFTKAGTYANPVEIITHLDKAGGREYARVIFEDYAQYLNFTDLDKKIKNSMWYATSIAASVDNWKDFGKAKSKTKEAIKRKPGTSEDLVQYFATADGPFTDDQLNARINARAVRNNVVIEDF